MIGETNETRARLSGGKNHSMSKQASHAEGPRFSPQHFQIELGKTHLTLREVLPASMEKKDQDGQATRFKNAISYVRQEKVY